MSVILLVPERKLLSASLLADWPCGDYIDAVSLCLNNAYMVCGVVRIVADHAYLCASILNADAFKAFQTDVLWFLYFRCHK